MNYLIVIAIATLFSIASIRRTDAQVPPPDPPSHDQLPNDPPSGGDQASDAQQPAGRYNWKTKTLGGQQFWTDVRYAGGWRIQKNSESGHYRLLDPKNKRNAWGDQLHCNQALDQRIADGTATACRGKVVIVLHGLIRTTNSTQRVADYLQQKGGYTPVNFSYASTRAGVGEHAAALRSLIDQLGPGVTEINFFGHSLGNLVVRRYLRETTDVQTGQQGDPRIRRIVMVGPPNQGSRMAQLLKKSVLFHTIAGVSGSELSRNWEALQPTLAIPACEFGIIAGGQKREDRFSNFVLDGKDDFTVSVEEAKLAGARDFLVRPLWHSTMMHQPVVLEAALNFFQHGYFISEQERVPLEADPQHSAGLENESAD